MRAIDTYTSDIVYEGPIFKKFLGNIDLGFLSKKES